MRQNRKAKLMGLEEAKAVFTAMFELDGSYSADRTIRVIQALVSQDQ